MKKKHITRTLSLMLAITMLMSLLTMTASATWCEFRPMESEAQRNSMSESAGKLFSMSERNAESGRTGETAYRAYITNTLNSLSQYMPGVTAEQKSNVIFYRYNPRMAWLVNAHTDAASAAELRSFYASQLEQLGTRPDPDYGNKEYMAARLAIPGAVNYGTASYYCGVATNTNKSGPLNQAAADVFYPMQDKGLLTTNINMMLHNTNHLDDEDKAALRAGSFLDVNPRNPNTNFSSGSGCPAACRATRSSVTSVSAQKCPISETTRSATLPLRTSYIPTSGCPTTDIATMTYIPTVH